MSIPAAMRRQLNMGLSKKVLVSLTDNKIVMEPVGDFWALSGSLKSEVTLSDAQLREARDSFSRRWADKNL